MMVMERMTWLDAAKYCKEQVMNSHLVAILNEQEQKAVFRYMKSLPGQLLYVRYTVFGPDYRNFS